MRLPEEVAKRWAREWANEGKEIDWRRLMTPRGYVALPRRWVAERTFSWFGRNRRMSKDYERLCASAEAFVSQPPYPVRRTGSKTLGAQDFAAKRLERKIL